MECVSEFVGETAARGLMDEGFDGSDERAVTGEPVAGELILRQ